jgi:hypothetical protein
LGSACADLYRRGSAELRGAAVGFDRLPPSKSTIVVEGELYHIVPRNMAGADGNGNDINLTSFPGKCSGVTFSLLFWLGKNYYKVRKVEDSIEISPQNANFYQITIAQKQQLEAQIKERLAGITSAINDYELMFHDLRKYRDFLHHLEERAEGLEKMKKAKNEKDKADAESEYVHAEQSLKSVFIDQVDVHTGEGVALKLIAMRWPTIIADFMGLDETLLDAKKIAEKKKVSEAEGVVLATKNKLYIEWRNMFEKIVKERYERMLGMVKARKFSIDEYKKMLTPYIERYKSINEKGSSQAGRNAMREMNWLKPGAQSTSWDSATIWGWKPMTRPDSTRITYENYGAEENVLKKDDFAPSFREVLKANYKDLKDKDVKMSPSGCEPFDKWSWALYRYIENYYTDKSGLQIRFSLDEIFENRKGFIGDKDWGDRNELYWKTVELGIDRFIIKLPDGTELEDLTFQPSYVYFDSYNFMFLRYLEFKAQEKVLEAYINEMLGNTTSGKDFGALGDEFEALFKVYSKTPAGKEDKTKKETLQEQLAGMKLRAARDHLQPQILKETSFMSANRLKLFKSSTYEPRFDDVITGPYFTDVGSSCAKVWNFIKAKFDVPGFDSPGVK